MVVRWRIKKILGMAEHGKSSFIAILTPVHALLSIKITSRPKPSFQHLIEAYVTSNLKVEAMASLSSQMGAGQV